MTGAPVTDLMQVLPLAGPPEGGPCTCTEPDPEPYEILWPERPHSRTQTTYVARVWCARCDGWLTARDVPHEEVRDYWAVHEPTAEYTARLALAAAWTATRRRRSKAQKNRRPSRRRRRR